MDQYHVKLPDPTRVAGGRRPRLSRRREGWAEAGVAQAERARCRAQRGERALAVERRPATLGVPAWRCREPTASHSLLENFR